MAGLENVNSKVLMNEFECGSFCFYIDRVSVF